MSTKKGQHPQEPMLTSLFNTMSSHNVDYCVLHSTDSLPFSIASDLDLAINNMDINTIEGILYEAATSINWAVCQKLWYDVPHCVYYLVRSRDSNAWAAIDFMIDSKGIGRYGFPVSDLVNQKIFKNGFYQTNPAVEFCYKIVKRIRKGELKSGDALLLHELLEASDKTFVESLLKKQLGKSCTNKIISIFSSPDGSINTGHLRYLLLWNHIVQRRIRHPLLFLQRIIMQCIRLFNRVYKPTGAILTILDSYSLSDDEIDEIIKNLSPAFRRVRRNVRSVLGVAKALSAATFVLNIGKSHNGNIALRENVFKKPYPVSLDKTVSRAVICDQISNAVKTLLDKRMGQASCDKG